MHNPEPTMFEPMMFEFLPPSIALRRRLRRFRDYNSCTSPCTMRKCGGGSLIFKLILGVLVLPLLFRVFAFFMLLALHVAFPVVMAGACLSLLSSHCESNPCKKAAQRTSKSAVVNGEDGSIKYIVPAPGVSLADLEIAIADNVLVVKGESVKGKDIFRVHERIEVPSGVDADTATATHTDGALTIVIETKKAKNIRVLKAE